MRDHCRLVSCSRESFLSQKNKNIKNSLLLINIDIVAYNIIFYSKITLSTRLQEMTINNIIYRPINNINNTTIIIIIIINLPVI